MSIKAPKDTAKMRMNICNNCDKLFKPTKTCKECGCFMNIKVWLEQAKCPLDKWNTNNTRG